MLSPRSPSRPASFRLARLVRVGGWALVLLSVAACTEARRKRDKAANPEGGAPEPAASAPAPAPAATAPAAPASSVPASAAPASAAASPAGDPATAAAPRRGLDPARAAGKVRLTLTIPKTLRLGGFSLVAAYDPDRFAVAEPVTGPAMQGYMCQANLAAPGTIRFNCAGLVNEDRGGLIATFEVAHAGAPPTPADFRVTDFEIVDDLAQKVAGVSPVLAMEPIAPR